MRATHVSVDVVIVHLGCITDIVVVGGGAAGLMAAIQAKTQCPHASVVILERAGKPLGKVKISGGGRCNVTHHCFDPATLATHYPRGERFLKPLFHQVGPQQVIDWFQAHGVTLKTEADGRMFPTTDDSETIIQALLGTAMLLGIRLYTQTSVREITVEPAESSEKAGFMLQLQSQNPSSPGSLGNNLYAKRVILATGSQPSMWTLAERLGHRIVPPVPSLFSAHIHNPALATLAGVTLSNVQLTAKLPKPENPKPNKTPDNTQIEKLTTTGPLLITHEGVSGPAMLKLSAWGAIGLSAVDYRTTLILDSLPTKNEDALRSLFLKSKEITPDRQIQNHCPVDVPQRFWIYLLQCAGFNPTTKWRDSSQKSLNRLVQAFKQHSLQMVGKSTNKAEFVTAGGVDLKEIHARTLESKVCPGLYFAGEVLNVDGVTGGFNFQNAWTTGWLAGKSAAVTLKEAPCINEA